MKAIRNLFRRLKHSPASRQGKKGSSLAIVMMVGAALVIWVMCIMPIMTTTGTVAAQTEESYDDYMIGRSAVEYCKSELEHIVETKIPHTFAVTGNPTDGFAVQPKRNATGYTTLDAYKLLASTPQDSKNDLNDFPISDSVVAICAVALSENKENVWDILITTYDKCDKVMSYSATFTGKGSLLIFPESYMQNQALPLSDFVVVDGKIGPHTLWNSTITMSNADSLNFVETLMPWIAPFSGEWSEDYANAKGYPAIFKTTANAASVDDSYISDPVTMGDLSSGENWVEPQAATYNTNEAGSIWFVQQSGKIRIKMYTDTTVDITSDCTVYLNGNVTYDRTVPTRGVYKVSVDYKGTDYSTNDNPSKYDPEKVNVLPKNGMQLRDGSNGYKEYIGEVYVADNTLTETAKIDKVEKKDKTSYGKLQYTDYSVTLSKPANDLLYGMASAGADSKVTWQSNNVFTFRIYAGEQPSAAYFFYICRPATYVDGVFKKATEPKMVGVMYKPEVVTSMSDGQYIMTSQDETKYLKSDLSVGNLSKQAGFVIGELNDVWSIDNTGSNSMTIQNPNGEYLTITGETTAEASNWKKERHDHNGDGQTNGWDGNNCYRITSVKAGDFESISLNLGLDIRSFNYSYSNRKNGFMTYALAIDNDVKYLEWTCNTKFNTELSTSLEDNHPSYLSLNGDSTTSRDKAYVKFMKVPEFEAPKNVKTPGEEFTIGNTVIYGTDVLRYVRNQLSGVELVALYANNQQVSSVLNTGIYHMVAKVKSNNVEVFVNLGILTVNKASLNSSDIHVNAVLSETDELRVDVSATGWHSDGGVRYFGYIDVNKPDDVYHWYASDDDTFTFRLKYSTYKFKIKESGTKNYSGTEADYDGFVEVKAKEVDATEININDFIFSFDPNAAEDKRVVWYKLPEKVNLDRVTLVFGVPSGEDGISWTDTYNTEVRFYGVVISNTVYDSLSNVFRISTPVNISVVNGRTSSMMRGSSLYFMGQTNSINTYGNKIYLTTDLLVLNKDITGGGHVYVEPFSTDESDPGDTLLFIADSNGIVRNGQKIFEGRTFYRIPEDTDLCNLTYAVTEGWIVVDEDVKHLFRENKYPEINLDIAYADEDQISSIISGETIGWTQDGELNYARSENEWNANYAVCAYLTSVATCEREHNIAANRILIASKVADDAGNLSSALYVPNSIRVYTRYISIEAAIVKQTASNVYFIIENLGQEEDFWAYITDAAIPTISKTLQLDCEIYTQIYDLSNALVDSKSAQIYRYQDGKDLFGGKNTDELMAIYKPSELESYAGALGLNVIDRYTSLDNQYNQEDTNIDDGKIDFSGFAGTQVNFYTNYMYISEGITSFEFKESKLIAGLLRNSSGINVNSQESGYTTNDYLGLFQTYSAESYSGTIVYFAHPTKIYVRSIVFSSWVDTYELNGFYYIEAKNGGTSLIDVAKDVAENGEDSVYYLDPEELPQYSVYINPDGTLSNAYVDTGLEDNNSPAVGGFSGGSIE